MIPAVAADLPEIEAFLHAHVERSMFPLINLRDHGWQGTHRLAPSFWLRRAGQITDVLTVTNEGMVMPQCPTGPWEAVTEVLRGRDLIGVIGPAEQARPLMAAAGLAEASSSLDEDEPFMVLDLARLRVPEGPGMIVPLADVEANTVLDWMRSYQREALQTPEAQVETRVQQGYAQYCARGSHVVLCDGCELLAMTGFNASLPNIVQIGGVFTPPHLRGRGFARRAVALHLAQAQETGVQRAVLFSGSDAARRAYASIGFVQDGCWTLRLFTPVARAA